MLSAIARKRSKKELAGSLMGTRAIVPTFNGMELPPGLGAGPLDVIGSLVGGLIPGISGKAASDTYSATVTAFGEQEVRRAEQKRMALLGGAAVTVVGLGVLAYVLLKK